ncbi:hypothetical protein IWX76_002405 [Pedobacter sp. CAN_A7]
MLNNRLNSNILTKYKLKKEPEIFRPFFLKHQPTQGLAAFIYSQIPWSFLLFTNFVSRTKTIRNAVKRHFSHTNSQT